MKQIIDYEFNFKEKVGEILEYMDCGKNALNYNVISILGSQSTGKSTLLNSLFGTNFKVMDKMSVGYCQTTKGLWLGVRDNDLRSPLLVWDVEGTDSLERGEDRITFENRAALFSLAISDCMIINIPLLNLTTYSSSNFGLLKTILNSWFSLKLGENEQGEFKTTLIFAIRDITINDNDEMLSKKINQILDLLWSQVMEVNKSQLNNSGGTNNSFITNVRSLHDVFEVKVYGVPSFPNEREGFFDVIGKIKSEIVHSILPKNYSRSIPIEGYEMYCKTIWNCIVNCEELNIPSQVKMISKFRCEKTKDDILGKMKLKIRNLKRSMEKKELEYYDFQNITYDILNESMHDYFEITGRYDSDMTLKTSVSMLVLFFIEFKDAVNTRMSAERQILRECKNILEYYCKDNQDIIDENDVRLYSNNIEDIIFDSNIWFEKELKKFDHLSLKWVTECPSQISKYGLVEQIRSQCIPEILSQIEKSNSNYKSTEYSEIFVNYNTNDQRKLFSETLEIQSRKIQEKLMQEFFESLIKDIIGEITKIFNEFGFTNPKSTINDFWMKAGESILKIHNSLFSKYETKWSNLLKGSYVLDEYTCTDNLGEEIAIQLIVRLILFIQQQSKYFHIQIIERFKKEFEIDEDGVPRQWIGEDSNILKELFINSKNNALSIIGVFKLGKCIFEIFEPRFSGFYSKIVEHPEIECISLLKNQSTNIELSVINCPLDESSYIYILPESTIHEIETKSIQEITGIYSKAQLLQSTGKQPQNIPWWMYLLLLFFGFDELMYILTSPFILTLLLVIGAFVYSYLTGNLPLFYNCSHKIVIISSKFIHFLTGILHNSLESRNNKFNYKQNNKL
ncbi:hypothetical protein FG379_001688 [Cryptosporidium bovis]|uniref:uncharacterized protein n=1 Tax=Cryptosporidium bovis TaxID=310047 RepID=UPI00351A4E4F|nr:hypothetical protein FG379_001688 [Cryptosporidium bovis]